MKFYRWNKIRIQMVERKREKRVRNEYRAWKIRLYANDFKNSLLCMNLSIFDFMIRSPGIWHGIGTFFLSLLWSSRIFFPGSLNITTHSNRAFYSKKLFHKLFFFVQFSLSRINPRTSLVAFMFWRANNTHKYL